MHSKKMGKKKKSEEEKGSKGGELLFCGSTNCNTVGRKTTATQGNLYSPTRLRPLVGINIRYVASGCRKYFFIALF